MRSTTEGQGARPRSWSEATGDTGGRSGTTGDTESRSENAASTRGRLETVFREESGRIVATLTRVVGVENLNVVEDVVQEAFVAALRRWPYHGIPDNPSAWLIQVAKNRAIDRFRRVGRHRGKEPQIRESFQRLSEGTADGDISLAREVRDDQLRMIFACCHPALRRDDQVALTLKTVGGFSVEELSAAFLIKGPTMAQRLVRAKRRLRDEGVRLDIPGPEEMAGRLDTVLEVVYLMYTGGSSAYRGESLLRPELCREAIRLGRLVVGHPLADDPAAHALTALLLLQGARLPGRTDAAGDLVLLAHQDRSSWDREMIRGGLEHLRRAARGDRLTAYHLQAEIAAHHTLAPDYEATDWAAILDCYDSLRGLNPSPVIKLNRAVALAQVAGPLAGLDEVERLVAGGTLEAYYPLHVARGELLARLGDEPAAAAALGRALELAVSEPVRRHLESRLGELDPGARIREEV